MPGPRRWIDPTTRDYVLENGSPRTDRTLASEVLLALTMQRGTCPLYADDEQIGSRIHTIQHATPQAIPLARSYAFEALGPLRPYLRALEIRADLVELQAPPGKGLAIVVSWEEGGRGSERRSVTHTTRIGG